MPRAAANTSQARAPPQHQVRRPGKDDNNPIRPAPPPRANTYGPKGEQPNKQPREAGAQAALQSRKERDAWVAAQGEPRFIDFQKLIKEGQKNPPNPAAIKAWPKDASLTEIHPDPPERPIDRKANLWDKEQCKYCLYTLGLKDGAAHSVYDCKAFRTFCLSQKSLAHIHSHEFPGRSRQQQ